MDHQQASGSALPPLCAFEDFLAFIRQDQGISRKTSLLESSLLERDLGITGDDGDDLLQAIQRKFGISFIGADFDLGEGQYLFHSEGLDLFGRTGNVKPLSVGELYRASCRAAARGF
jgi:hypothetical protein